MALLEKEATRFAESLDDYEHVSVTDIGGWGPHGFCASLARGTEPGQFDTAGGSLRRGGCKCVLIYEQP